MSTSTEAAQRNLASLLASIDEMIFVVDQQARIVEANAAVQCRLGFTLDALVGQSIYTLHPRELHDEYARRFDALLAGDARTVRVYLLQRDGGRLPVEVTVTRAVWNDAPVMVGVARDVSERLAAEQGLRASEERYRAIVEDQTELICRWTPDGTLTFVNDAYCRHFNRSRASLLGQSVFDLIPVSDRELVASALTELTPVAPARTVEHRVLLPSGAAGWLQWTNRALFDTTGALVELQSVGRDITARREAEEALRSSDERYALATAAGKVGVFDWHIPSGGFYLDDNLKRLLGYEPHELGDHLDEWSALVHPDDQASVAAETEAVFAGRKQRFTLAHRMLHRNGDIRWILARANLIRAADGTPLRLVGTDTDITSQRQLAAALETSQRHYEALVNTLPDLIARVDRRLRHVFVSQRYAEVAGLAREEIIGRTPEELGFAPALVDRWRSVLEEVVARGASRDFHFDFETPHGLRHYHARCVPELNDAGEVATVLCVSRDITEQQAAEAALRESEADLRTIFDSTPDVILLADRNRRLRAFNRIAETRTLATHGRPLQRGADILDYALPDSRDAVTANVNAALGGRRIVSEVYIREIDEWFEIRFHPARGADGTSQGVCVTALSITDRKQAEAALRESEARYRNIFEHATLGIYQSTLAGRFISVNEAFARMVGYDTPAELIGQMENIGTELHADPTRREELVRHLTERGRLLGIECRLKRRDGQPLTVNVHARLVDDRPGQPPHVEGFVEDVTERVLLEERARQQAAELNHAARLRLMGEMASGLAHELNQPLCGILSAASGGLRMLTNRVDAPADLVHVLSVIDTQSRRAAEIIRRMRAFGSKHNPVRQPVDINSLIRDIVTFLGGEARAAGVTVELELAAGLPPITADPVEVQQVLLNLARNGIEAMQATAHRILTIRSSMRAAQVEVLVRDRGTGIATADLEHLFDPFFTTKSGGMGLGLSISQGIIESHGGRLWADTNPQGGADFRFTIGGAERCSGSYPRSNRLRSG